MSGLPRGAARPYFLLARVARVAKLKRGKLMFDTAPAKPIIALTLAVAGKRRIDDDKLGPLNEKLALIYRGVAVRLASLGERPADPDPLTLRFARGQPPRLALVTGLADGADREASKTFTITMTEFADAGASRVDSVLGAVLPCNTEDFVTNSSVADRSDFEIVAQSCAFIVELDGRMPPSPTDPVDDEPHQDTVDRFDRTQAFTSQSETLLRQADVLVAIDDPKEAGRPGGTRQTIRAALELGMPVIMLQLGREGMAVMRSRADLDQPVLLPDADAHTTLGELVTEMVGATAGDTDYVKDLLCEFYADQIPDGGIITRAWIGFEKVFKRGRPPSSLAATVAYESYRRRASALSNHYASLHRGSFLLGYVLALIAVILAVGALLFLVFDPDTKTNGGVNTKILLCLTVIKLVAVSSILFISIQANRKKLSHRVADYRYLSERLRAMIYLPSVGCLRTRYNWSLPYTTRVTAQGVIDQLFLSIVRQANPLQAMPGELHDRTIAPNAGSALNLIETDWIVGQKIYHLLNAANQSRLNKFLKRLSSLFNIGVIGTVLVDIVLTVLKLSNVPLTVFGVRFDGIIEPLLIASVAILPAAVASLNGIRFQSECARLADRSEIMAAQLLHLEQKSSQTKLTAVRTLDVLRLAEDVARSTIDEVAEWSAIYGKDFTEM